MVLFLRKMPIILLLDKMKKYQVAGDDDETIFFFFVDDFDVLWGDGGAEICGDFHKAEFTNNTDKIY